MRRKRVSRRRWKARCRAGRAIPAYAIHDHRLGRWFDFVQIGVNADLWQALPPR